MNSLTVRDFEYLHWLMNRGDRVTAVKHVQTLSGVSLMDAKEYVDHVPWEKDAEVLRNQPAMDEYTQAKLGMVLETGRLSRTYQAHPDPYADRLLQMQEALLTLSHAMAELVHTINEVVKSKGDQS